MTRRTSAVPWASERDDFKGLVHSLGIDMAASAKAVQISEFIGPRAEQLAKARRFHELGYMVAIGGDPTTDDPDEVWRFWAYEPRAGSKTPRYGAFVWVEPHSFLCAWLLTMAWRVDALQTEASLLIERQQIIAAACLARSALETAGALVDEVPAVEALWEACKAEAPPGLMPFGISYANLRLRAMRLLFGGRWKNQPNRSRDASPPSVARYVTALQALDSSAEQTYEVLCNTVHPSVGGTIAHAGGTDDDYEHAEHFRKTWTFTRDQSDDSHVAEHVCAGVRIALSAAAGALDCGVRLADDICLTTRLGEFVGQQYWRTVSAGERNDRCPCRSGRKVKNCPHDWRHEPSAHTRELTARFQPISPPPVGVHTFSRDG